MDRREANRAAQALTWSDEQRTRSDSTRAHYRSVQIESMIGDYADDAEGPWTVSAALDADNTGDELSVLGTHELLIMTERTVVGVRERHVEGEPPTARHGVARIVPFSRIAEVRVDDTRAGRTHAVERRRHWRFLDSRGATLFALTAMSWEGNDGETAEEGDADTFANALAGVAGLL